MTIKIIIKRDLKEVYGQPILMKIASLYVDDVLDSTYQFSDKTSFREAENVIIKYCRKSIGINPLDQTSYKCEYRK